MMESKESEPRRGCSWQIFIISIIVFLVLCLAVTIPIRMRLQQNSMGLVLGEPAPGLGLLERFYLRNYLMNHVEALQAPAGNPIEVQFEITAGSTASEVIDNLVAAGVLDDPELLRNYLRYYGLDANLQTGQFTISGADSILQLANKISDFTGRNVILNALPGMRIEELAAYIAAVAPGRIDADQFLSIASGRIPFDRSPYSFLNGIPEDGSLEGYLLPGSYSIPPEADALYLIQAMLNNFDQQVTPSMRQSFGAADISLHEAVTLASIVARETFDDGERPLIASVYLNRVQEGMLLQADPTVQYAAGYQPASQNWWKVPLSVADLRLNHPYNTYVYGGLPPGPIANPGLSSLQAIARPAATDYLFFVLDCSQNSDGRHIFTRTYDEHLAYARVCHE